MTCQVVSKAKFQGNDTQPTLATSKEREDPDATFAKVIEGPTSWRGGMRLNGLRGGL
jgi:hypothetical protein